MKITYEYCILPKSTASLGGVSTVFYLQELKKLWGSHLWKTKYPLRYYYQTPENNGRYAFYDGGDKEPYPFVNRDEGYYFAHKLFQKYPKNAENGKLEIGVDVFVEDTPLWQRDISEGKQLIDRLKDSVSALVLAKAHNDIKNALNKVQSDVTQLKMWYNF